MLSLHAVVELAVTGRLIVIVRGDVTSCEGGCRAGGGGRFLLYLNLSVGIRSRTMTLASGPEPL